MSLAIVGSRGFTDYARLSREVDAYVRELGGHIKRIVSGGATGADTLAERYAKDNGLELVVHPAEWHLHGRKAGPLRNATIIADADYVIAFPSAKNSPGTQDIIAKAAAAKKPTRVVVA